MAYTYKELHGKTVAQLREIAAQNGHELLKGHSVMHKAELLSRLCQVLGIEPHEEHSVVGINKAKVKKEIRQLKLSREDALEAHDSKKVKVIRRKIRALKRKIRSATV